MDVGSLRVGEISNMFYVLPILTGSINIAFNP